MEILENNLFKGKEIDVCCPIDGTKLIHDENYSQFGREWYSCKTCGALYNSLNEKDLIKEAMEYLGILKKLNECDKLKINQRDKIIKIGREKGLI